MYQLHCYPLLHLTCNVIDRSIKGYILLLSYILRLSIPVDIWFLLSSARQWWVIDLGCNVHCLLVATRTGTITRWCSFWGLGLGLRSHNRTTSQRWLRLLVVLQTLNPKVWFSLRWPPLWWKDPFSFRAGLALQNQTIISNYMTWVGTLGVSKGTEDLNFTSPSSFAGLASVSHEVNLHLTSLPRYLGFYYLSHRTYKQDPFLVTSRSWDDSLGAAYSASASTRDVAKSEDQDL